MPITAGATLWAGATILPATAGLTGRIAETMWELIIPGQIEVMYPGAMAIQTGQVDLLHTVGPTQFITATLLQEEQPPAIIPIPGLPIVVHQGIRLIVLQVEAQAEV
tara:strand:+ start:246 stop:566 length:321 start_codon:yes stop_codon:yes gene_type:complete